MASDSDTSLYIGVDVGTGSARAALVDSGGKILRTAERDIRMWTPTTDYYEQSSEDIWNSVCLIIKEITSDVDVHKIKGIGFDATCSLVALDTNFQPITVSPTGNNEQNIIMWLDHRAGRQADFINNTRNEALKYVGGKVSLEQECPKLLWLKQNLRSECWDKAGHFLDLADFLAWKATNSLSRSLCTLVSKYQYQANESQQSWSDSYLQQTGLEDLMEGDYRKIGNDVQPPGRPVADGLHQTAADQLGLVAGTPVATPVIDAHAGGIGVIACDVKGHGLPCENQPITARLALICGTSTCHMAISQDLMFVDGVWGPYYSAMVPGYWLHEGGQSATGKLIDHVITTHPAFQEVKEKADKRNCSVYSVLNEHVASLAETNHVTSVGQLTKDFHMWPDFHGNRSPVADASLKGMICGLNLATDIDSLAVLYLATVQSIALGTRHILDTMNQAGHKISTIFACGGLCKNSLYLQVHADAAGMCVVLPRETESVLLGAAILGACASGQYSSLQEAMQKMSGVGHVVRADESEKEFYDKKYKVFLKMLEHQREYQDIMQ